MTTNSPNPVDGDVQALIEYCKEEVRLKTEHIERLEKHMPGQFDLTRYQMELQTAQIALAALTAQPVAWVVMAPHGDYIESNPDCVANIEGSGDAKCKPLFTTPPAQLLRPVELPSGFRPAIGDIFDRQAPVMRRDKEDGDWLHKVTVAELLRSLGHEVKS